MESGRPGAQALARLYTRASPVVMVVTLVAVAALSAAGVWWRMSHQGPSVLDMGSQFGFGDPEDQADFFVLTTSESSPLRVDRPSVPGSLLRLGVTMVVTTAILVAVAYLIGLILKLQLDRYFSSGS